MEHLQPQLAAQLREDDPPRLRLDPLDDRVRPQRGVPRRRPNLRRQPARIIRRVGAGLLREPLQLADQGAERVVVGEHAVDVKNH